MKKKLSFLLPPSWKNEYSTTLVFFGTEGKNYTFYSLSPEKNKSSTTLVFYGTEEVRTNGDMKY
jgi:hypothetical protein